jgi:hypothetical protein
VSANVTDTVIYDSNVFGTPNATDDFSDILAPRVTYLRQAALVEAQASAGLSIIRYLQQTQLNAENWDANASLRLNATALRNYSGSLTAGYAETAQIDPDLNARINAKTTTLVGQSALVTGPRSDLALNANYTDAQRTGASNQQAFAAQALYHYRDFMDGYTASLVADFNELQSSGTTPFNVPLDQHSYALTAGLSRAFAGGALHAGINYGYRIINRSQMETSSGTRRQTGSVISATLDGPFLPAKYFPKVQSHFALAYESEATPGLNDPGSKQLTGSLNLEWQARENTSVTFVTRRSQRLSANDLSVVESAVQLGLEQKLRYNLVGNLTGGYAWSSYRATARQDQTVSLSAALKYNFARSWEARLAYAFNSTSSNVGASGYDRHLLSLSLGYQF